MAFAALFQKSNLASTGPVSIAMLQQAMFLAKAIQELGLKLKEELDLIIKEQIALHNNSNEITEGFIDRLIVMEDKINHLERSSPPIQCSMDITEEFSNDSGTLRHHINQLMEACNQIETNVDQRFARALVLPEKMKANMATTTRNSQTPSTRDGSQKAKSIKVSRLPRNVAEDETSSEKDRNDSEEA